MLNAIVRLLLRVAHRLALVYWYILRPRVEGAYVAVWHDDDVLLIRNSYRAEYSFPAGGPKRGESLEETAIRELYEEVGIRTVPSQLRRIGRFFTDIEFRQDYSTVFELVLDTTPAVRIDGREVVQAEFTPYGDALQRRLTPIVAQYFEWREQHINSSGATP